MSVLSLEALSVDYGPVRALDRVTLSLERGQVGAVIGPNGAGKSTLLMAVSGLVPPSNGSVALDGQSLEHVPAFKRLGLGVAHVLEGHRVFGDQSVQDNLLLGGLARYRSRSRRREVLADVEEQYQRFPRLAERRRSQAGTLSGGEQQMLAIAAALMSRPSILLLDEPSLGLAPRIIDEIFELIDQLRSEGLTILLVEQLASLALSVADVGWVLGRGAIVNSGAAAQVLDDLNLREVYLGTEPKPGPL